VILSLLRQLYHHGVALAALVHRIEALEKRVAELEER